MIIKNIPASDFIKQRLKPHLYSKAAKWQRNEGTDFNPSMIDYFWNFILLFWKEVYSV